MADGDCFELLRSSEASSNREMPSAAQFMSQETYNFRFMIAIFGNDCFRDGLFVSVTPGQPKPSKHHVDLQRMRDTNVLPQFKRQIITGQWNFLHFYFSQSQKTSGD
jgi:hypothetical protein